MATAGETADNWKDSNRGREGHQPKLQLPWGGTHKQAMEHSIGLYPQGCLREGEDKHPNRTVKQATNHANGKTTTSAVCSCGKVCKNQHGLKIHQAKMKCLTGKRVEQHIGPVPGETQEEPGQESTHSAQTLHAPQASPYVRHSEHHQVMRPVANKERGWLQFDEDLDQALEATAKGDADQKLWTMAAMIISIGEERFGIKEQQPTRGRREPKRRKGKISQLRQELRLLGRQFK